MNQRDVEPPWRSVAAFLCIGGFLFLAGALIDSLADDEAAEVAGRAPEANLQFQMGEDPMALSIVYMVASFVVGGVLIWRANRPLMGIAAVVAALLLAFDIRVALQEDAAGRVGLTLVACILAALHLAGTLTALWGTRRAVGQNVAEVVRTR